ncbi:MAG: metallophosphoesterase family protein [Armatimonadota bacterium]|nr:MAG: metallophosphoesterase family protein [Armatimonadota bacterium]
MTIAAFSDIHANRHALDALLADIRQRAYQHVVCLGDLVGYGAFPNEVIETIRAAGIPTLAGNYDDGVGFDRDQCGCAYTRPDDIARGDRSLRWTQRVVTNGNKAWLRSLPRDLRLTLADRRILCVHGSPRHRSHRPPPRVRRPPAPRPLLVRHGQAVALDANRLPPTKLASENGAHARRKTEEPSRDRKPRWLNANEPARLPPTSQGCRPSRSLLSAPASTATL